MSLPNLSFLLDLPGVARAYLGDKLAKLLFSVGTCLLASWLTALCVVCTRASLRRSIARWP